MTELGSGQSFAMAGLLRSTDQGSVAKVPVLGDIPGLGVLFRSVRFEQQQTELVVMVTAEVVEPLDDGRARPVPGDLTEAPIKTQFGYHVIKVEDRRKAPPSSYEEMADALREEMAREVITGQLDQLRSGAKVEKFAMDGSKPDARPAAPAAKPTAPAVPK